MSKARLLIVVVALVAAALPAAADSSFNGQLAGTQEVPPNVSTASGSVTVVLNSNQTQITVNMSFSGLVGTHTASHIHGPAPAGVSAAVIFPLTVVPANTQNGQVTNQVIAVTPAQAAELKAGLWYVNVHSSVYPGGEIRAQLEYVPENVPVASAWGLAALCALIAAAGALMLLRR